MKKNIVWFDLETTGISTTADRIIEICMIKTDFDGNEIETYNQLVNPGNVEMRAEAEEKHGISLEMLKDKPTFEMIASEMPYLDKQFQNCSREDLTSISLFIVAQKV